MTLTIRRKIQKVEEAYFRTLFSELYIKITVLKMSDNSLSHTLDNNYYNYLPVSVP